MVHSSKSKENVKETKKRPFPSFTCTTCQSTFASKHKMKIHVKSEHEDAKKEASPHRKIAKKEDLNNRINPEESMDEEVLEVVVHKEDYKNKVKGIKKRI
jgi:hypothetical protein